jgi:PAS domain S-box-containing protein
MWGKLSGVHGFNKLLAIVIAIQLLILGGIASLLIMPVVGDTFHLQTVLSGVFLGLICVPVSIFLYSSSKNRDLKIIFLGLSLSYILLFFSGLFWFAFPKVNDVTLVADAGALLSLAVYLPTLAALAYLLKARIVEARSGYSAIILFINVTAAAVILSYVFLNLVNSQGDAFLTAIYTLSAMADIAILTTGSMLAIINMKDQMRYIFPIIIVIYIFCLIGDSISLMLSFGQNSPILATQDFYDLAIIFGGIALPAYALVNIKVTTVEEVDKKLHDVENSLQDIVMQTPDAICVFDLKGDAVLANQAFIGLVGEKPADVHGKINLFRDADRLIEGSGAKISKVREGETVIFDGERPGSAKDAGRRFYHARAFPTLGIDRKIASYTVMLADITDRRRYEEELSHARAQAELYLDLMGHDINNMNQIGIGFLEMALEKIMLSKEEEMLIRKPLSAMHNSTRLIDNVQKIRFADTGALSVEPVDIGLLLTEVIRDYHQVPGREITVEYAPVRDCYVSANPLLKDVFSNLINNAVKHSRGPLKVWINVLPGIVDGKKQYRIALEDNGPGIPDDIKQVVLDGFYHLRARGTGSGLGLFLVKSLVNSFNGTITLEDRVSGSPDQGTRIVITLPATEKRAGIWNKIEMA